MKATTEYLLATVGGPPRPPEPVVLITTWSPGSPTPDAAPMPGDRFGDDPRLGFRPVA